MNIFISCKIYIWSSYTRLFPSTEYTQEGEELTPSTKIVGVGSNIHDQL